MTGTYGDDINITAQVTVGDVAASLIDGTIEFEDGGTTLGSATVENGTATLTVLGSERDKQHALFGEGGNSTFTAAYTGNGNINGESGTGTATIGQRTLEYDVTATGREYEPGKTEVEVSLTPKNHVEGDDVTLTATGNLSAADVAIYESVSLTEITIGGTDKAYYTVSSSADNVTLTAPVTISQIKAIVETPPTGKADLTYTGDPLGLLTGEGTSTGGTMQYYVGKKDSTEQPDEAAAWKEDISDITATEAGTYTVWYRANGNIDYSTSDLGYITVTIAKATPTVTVQAVTSTYGDDINITAEVTVPGVDASLVTGTIEFEDGGTTLGTASVENGTATLTVLGSERDKQHALFGEGGSSTVTAAYNGNDNIISGSGNGTATISQRTLKYTVTADDREYIPGSTEVTVHLTPTDFVEGDDVTLTATGNLSAADVATYESVSLTEITIGGTDKAYYTVADKADNAALASPVTISQTKAIVETLPTGETDLTYTGDPLGLLTGGGTSTGGTMQYYVGEKDSTEQYLFSGCLYYDSQRAKTQIGNSSSQN